MEKIIIRKNILPLGCKSSALISLSDKKYKNKEELLKDFCYDELIKTLFNEKNETYESLRQSYLELMNSDKIENDKFVVACKIDDEFGFVLNANIYLYHLPLGERILDNLVPWYYADSKKYLGDTWWETDEEILKSVKELSLIDFLKKYKGYVG